MPYSFIYDLTHLPQNLLGKMLETACNTGLHSAVSNKAKMLVKMFKINEATGLNVSEAITLFEDLIEVQIANRTQREQFEKAEHKAILVPHCARMFMDKRCMADFDPEIPSYKCNSCNDKCIVNKATTVGRKRGYDVYVIPGGSCAEKILKNNDYQGVVGVACGTELKMATGLLKKLGIAGQGIFLTRNGCANTTLNWENLERAL